MKYKCIKCDICGREIPKTGRSYQAKMFDTEYIARKGLYYSDGSRVCDKRTSNTKLDICNNCYSEFCHFVKLKLKDTE